NHALVAVAARHLVAGLQLAFHCDEDFDHLHYAWRQLVTSLQLFNFALKARGKPRDSLFHLVFQGLDIRHYGVVADRDLFPVRHGVLGEHDLGDLGAGPHALGPTYRDLAEHQFLKARSEAAFEDRALVVAILGEPFDFGAFDGQSTLVLVDPAPREDAHFDDRAGDPGWQPSRSVPHVGSLFAEDSAQQLFL